MTAMPPTTEAVAPPLPLLVAADLQDQLLAAGLDLERLQRLLAGSCDTLLACFSAAIERLGEPDAADALRARLADAVTALQFQDMASQLIGHTQQRLRNCADRLAADAFGPDPDGEAVVAKAPLRPNPVTQDEMDAGSVTLF